MPTQTSNFELEGKGASPTQTPVISADITYAAGDAVGGMLTFALAVDKSGGRGWVDTLVLADEEQQQASFDLVLFDQTFSATTDNAAFAPSDADLANCVGHIPIATGDYANYNTNCEATVRNVGFKFTVADTSLCGQLVNRSTNPIWTAVDSLRINLEISQD